MVERIEIKKTSIQEIIKEFCKDFPILIPVPDEPSGENIRFPGIIKEQKNNNGNNGYH